jgi:glutamate/tyrosine decarboxylase-like PLP-dependent enzyme
MTDTLHSEDIPRISLDPSTEQVERWGRAAIAWMADYLDSLRERRVYPATTAREIRERLETRLPEAGADFEQLLAVMREVVVPFSRHNGHPRMFGYVQGPGTAIAALADLLASALNANLTAWRSAPAAVEIERLTIDWIKQILGYPTDAAGLFVSGGSMANFAALAAARHTKAPLNVSREGAHHLSQAMRVYVSAETHHSISKAAALLGIGSDNVRAVAVDQRFRINTDDLATKVTEDVRDGHLPFCVVANAGTVATGAFDALDDVSRVARQLNLWLHVDASYGGGAVLARSARHLFAAISEADSVALDPHKWLYLPVDCGCVLYRDAETARATFAHDAEYTRMLADKADEAFAYWDYGPELSRRFRALKVWMMLKGVGVGALSEAVENDLACARHLEQLVRASTDFEMLAPVELSIFCFRYVPARFRQELESGDEPTRARAGQQLNELNERLLVALQRDGSSYLSNALLGGRFALRGCVMNYRTTPRDMERLLDDLRRVARQIEAAV